MISNGNKEIYSKASFLHLSKTGIWWRCPIPTDEISTNNLPILEFTISTNQLLEKRNIQLNYRLTLVFLITG
jgi:hypothetical protein